MNQQPDDKVEGVRFLLDKELALLPDNKRTILNNLIEEYVGLFGEEKWNDGYHEGWDDAREDE